MEISATSQVTLASSTSTSAKTASTGSEFSALLATSLATGKADFVSGRLGIDLDKRGQPAAVIYFDESGNKLRSSTFTAENILKYSSKYGIDLADLSGLGEQLDTAGVGYRPYELYKGTGSDHGIDFADLIAGGLGTAYDWRKDANVALKGPSAQRQLEVAQALADSLGVVKHAEITQELGIDPTRFAPLAAAGEAPRTQVMFNGQVAAWYRTAAEASSAATLYQGQVVDLTQTQQDSTVATSDASTSQGATAIAASDPSTAIQTDATTSEASVAQNGMSSDLTTQLQNLLNAANLTDQRSALDTFIATLTALRQSA